MALRKPLVLNAGKPQQLQAGDSITVASTNTNAVIMTNGEAAAISIGTATYVFSSSTVKKAQANAAASANVFGLVYDVSITNGAAGSIATEGYVVATTVQWDAVTGQTGGLTAGSDYYLDPTTSGKITTTPPSTVGQYVVNLGTAMSATEIMLNPQIEILL